MAKSQSRFPDEQAADAGPSLDQSLAQLEEALDSSASDPSPENNSSPEIQTEVMPIHHLRFTSSPAKSLTIPPQEQEATIQHLAALKKKNVAPAPTDIPQWTGDDLILTPDDENPPPQRWWPEFTDPQKRIGLLVGGGLLFFGLIGFLLWQQQKSEQERWAASRLDELYARPLSMPSLPASPVSSETPEASPTASASTTDDKALSDNVRQILLAYNPAAVGTRYKIEVREGVVTLSGEAQSQMEKEGAENVIKPLQGITKIVNNLVLRPVTAGPSGPVVPGVAGPVMYPKVNEAEAKRLEDALRRDLAEGAKRAEEERLRIEQQNAALAAQRADETARQEADRLHRQQTAAQQNEENARIRQQAEERAKREKEEQEQRLEEQRRAEAQRAEKARPAELHSGTVSWSGIVKGVDEIVIRGSSAGVNHLSGDPLGSPRASFSTAIPNAPISVRLVAASGKSPIRIVQQPSAANNFTTIVRVGDGTKGDGKPHSFTLRWSSQ